MSIEIDGQRYSWTQPQCELCWLELHENRQPHRLVDAAQEQCAFCGTLTESGIYVRVDPRTVLYPTVEEEQG